LLAIPLADPSVLGVPDPVVVPLVDELPPCVGVPDDPNALELPNPLVPDEDPNALELPNPLVPDEDPNALEPPNPLVPVEELPNPELGCPAAPPCPCEANPAADPSPGATPLNGCPKNPFTVVFASPIWINRQSAFPVIGSKYCCRRYRTLFVFSNCSIDPG
jgi:hypothetical protein